VVVVEKILRPRRFFPAFMAAQQCRRQLRFLHARLRELQAWCRGDGNDEEKETMKEETWAN
jgi:hypothetical protein